MTTLLAACALYVQSAKSACYGTYYDDRAVCQCLAGNDTNALDPDAKASLRKCYDKAAFARTACVQTVDKTTECP